MKQFFKTLIIGFLLTIILGIIIWAFSMALTSCDSTKGEWKDINDPNTYWSKDIQYEGVLEVGQTVTFWVHFPPEFNYKKRWSVWNDDVNVLSISAGDTVRYRIKRKCDLTVLVAGYNKEGTQILNSWVWHRKIE